jgi:hypothetical protein
MEYTVLAASQARLATLGAPVKQKLRYRHKTKGAGLATSWLGNLAPEDVALLARYVGSGEHKALPIDPSYDIEPVAHKRSDSSRCDPKITREQAELVLREAIKLGNVSAEFQGDFPAYAWGRIDAQFYVA